MSRWGSEAGAVTDLATLDLDYLSRQCFGDAVLARELLVLFSAQLDKLGPALAAPGADGDKADLAHTLKGSARAVGAFFLGAQAEAYEAALRDGDPQAGRLLAPLMSAMDAARGAVAREI